MTIFNVIELRRGRRYANGVQESPRSCGALERINVDGEPIAYGHMIGATGARLFGGLVNNFQCCRFSHAPTIIWE
jgi:acetyl-CoA acetyltransferase